MRYNIVVIFSDIDLTFSVITNHIWMNTISNTIIIVTMMYQAYARQVFVQYVKIQQRPINIVPYWFNSSIVFMLWTAMFIFSMTQYIADSLDELSLLSLFSSVLL